MQSSIDFSGMWIPNITPFKKDNVYEVDSNKLKQLIDYLIDKQKADGIVPCGTTGENNTLTIDEDKEVIQTTLEHAAGRVPVMAGTGSNDTRSTIKMTKFAEEIGINAVLIVCPYFNRPDQKGLFEHYSAIAQATSLPIFIYNIPGRTGRNVDPDTITALAQKFPNIMGVKDAANDISQTMRLINAKKEINHPFYVVSGEDILTYLNIALGGDGAISASAHIVGAEMKKMMNSFNNKDIEKARSIHFQIMDIINLLFKEPNPEPVKAAFDLMGFDFGGDLRLPLVKASDTLRQELQSELQKLGKI